MMASLTRTVGFHALHRLYRPEWGEARNREVFGPVSDAPGHGHDYQCAVTVRGRQHLNLDVPAFAYGKTLPTCEAIAAYVFRRVAPRLPAELVLERVRIMEDPTLYGDCTGLD